MNKLSSYKIVFNNFKDLFTNALSNIGLDHKIKFEPLTENQDRKRNKNREKIVRFNLPYGSKVAINIGKTFLLL